MTRALRLGSPDDAVRSEGSQHGKLRVVRWHVCEFSGKGQSNRDGKQNSGRLGAGIETGIDYRRTRGSFWSERKFAHFVRL